MSIIITHPELEALLAELGAATGKTPSDLILDLARSEQERLDREKEIQRRREVIDRISAEYRRHMPEDTRSIDEIIGYDENGLPT